MKMARVLAAAGVATVFGIATAHALCTPQTAAGRARALEEILKAQGAPERSYVDPVLHCLAEPQPDLITASLVASLRKSLSDTDVRQAVVRQFLEGGPRGQLASAEALRPYIKEPAVYRLMLQKASSGAGVDVRWGAWHESMEALLYMQPLSEEVKSAAKLLLRPELQAQKWPLYFRFADALLWRATGSEFESRFALAKELYHAGNANLKESLLNAMSTRVREQHSAKRFFVELIADPKTCVGEKWAMCDRALKALANSQGVDVPRIFQDFIENTRDPKLIESAKLELGRFCFGARNVPGCR
ncbi:MAG: hypothetical protein HY078_16620 [Elusimicrobia bacterium]|nr:hypothetical protein [Elusimicrobiota bacterium]